MAYLDSSSALISAVITDSGKTILAQNPWKFKIVKWAVSDDEIDYTQSITSITGTPIPEPNISSTSTNNYVKTFDKGTSRLAELSLSQSRIILTQNTIGSCTISTDTVEETLGYTVYCSNDNLDISPIDLVDNQNDAQKVSFSIFSSLSNLDSLKVKRYTEITPIISPKSIICKNTFQIVAKNAVGKYLLTIVGNTSKAKTILEVFVKA